MQSSYLVVEIPIDKVVVEKRLRKDLGDIDSLAASIERHGLLHAIVVEQNHKSYILRAGERRLRACKTLHWKHIPAHVISGDK